VPLDSTNRVPVTHAFMERIHAQQASRAAQLAKKILDTQHSEIENGTFYFWDPLAAAIMTEERLATFETKRIAVATSDDADNGRIALTEDGAPVRVAVDADGARFEQTFLQTLNGQFK
jgi:inosine-uridine nucleoside N-ribohydrolase